MSGIADSPRTLTCLGGALLALAVGACGGSSSGEAASVGDCIDAGKQVVDCSSPSAKQKLVSDQSAKNAIACVQIGANPQVQVKVDGGKFCAERK
jgi:hypothetical protein